MYTNPHIHKLLADERVATLRSDASSDTGRRTRGRSSGTEVARMLRSAAAGDSGAWNHLVAEFAGMVSAIARAHRLNEADAADVSQSTWTKLFERVDQIHEPAAVGAWLATTARRESLRVIRASRRHVFMGDDVPDVASPDSEPGEELLIAVRNEALWRCFARLRPSDQSLLSLLMTDPRPAYEEISAVLDMPIGSIGPTRARALERLRKEVERENELSRFAE